MALILVRRIKKDDGDNPAIDVLLVSSTNGEVTEQSLAERYPEYVFDIPEETLEHVEQFFNEQYGGIAILQTV